MPIAIARTLRIAALAAPAMALAACIETDRQTLYELEFNGVAYPVVARYPAGTSLEQARANGTADIGLVTKGYTYPCDGSREDCQRELDLYIERANETD